MSKSMTDNNIKHLAKLSNLNVSEELSHRMTYQFNEIVAHFEKLQEVDTEGIFPFFFTTDEENILLDDEVEISDVSSELDYLNTKGKRDNKYFIVPKIYND